MYAYLNENNEFERCNMSSRFKDVGAFHLLTDEQRVQYNFYPCSVVNENYDARTQNRSTNPTFELKDNIVIATYTIINKAPEQILMDMVTQAEQAVQSHINAKCIELGYDNENSIAKYLVEGNPFYTQCKAISLWIGAVWVKAHEVQADVLSGTIPMPTVEELIAMLPEYVA